MAAPIVILGGGISGLSAAHYLLQNPRIGPVVLLEASDRLGGWIRSRQSPSGAVFEEGPRTIRPRGPAGKNTLDLVDRLNLTNKIIPIKSDHSSAKNRMIYVGGKLHTLPNSLTGMFKVNSPFNRPLITMLMNDLRAPLIEKDDESIYSFVERRLGKDVADNLISPMICGICAGNAKEISVNFLMRSFFEAEQEHGSISKGMVMKTLNKLFKASEKSGKIDTALGNRKSEDCQDSAVLARKEKWSIWSLKGGLEQLPLELANDIKSRGAEVCLDTKCEKVTFKPNEVEMKINGQTKTYSRIISSLSAKSFADLVDRQHPQLARELRAIPSVTVAVVNLQFQGNVLPQEAFGFLVPPNEKLPILGVIFDSCVFPQENSTVVTVMMGGAWFETNFGAHPTKEHLLSVAVHQVKSILGIGGAPVAHNVAILRDCIPQHVVGHSQRLNRIHNYISAHKLPLSLCGSSYQGVGLNDVILSAKEAVSNIA